MVKQKRVLCVLLLLQTHNPAFAGGCLASFAGEEDKKGLFVSPSGANFDTLSILSNKCGGAPVAQWVRRWHTGLAVLSSSPA